MESGQVLNIKPRQNNSHSLILTNHPTRITLTTLDKGSDRFDCNHNYLFELNFKKTTIPKIYNVITRRALQIMTQQSSTGTSSGLLLRHRCIRVAGLEIYINHVFLLC